MKPVIVFIELYFKVFILLNLFFVYYFRVYTSFVFIFV